jgi:ligand-binding sensor domain-containing protein
VEDLNGNVWVNMRGGGFGYYDEAAKTIQSFLNTPDVANLHLPQFVYAIYYDPAGILWLTTNERQLVKILLQDNYFNQHLLVDKEKNRWDNEVRGIYYDKQNRLWVGAKNGKLKIFGMTGS